MIGDSHGETPGSKAAAGRRRRRWSESNLEFALCRTARRGHQDDPRKRRVVCFREGIEAQARRGGEGSVTTVNLRPNESQESLLKRFRKKVTRAGILSTVRRKRWFVSKSELRRIQKKKAIRRIKRRERKLEGE